VPHVFCKKSLRASTGLLLLGLIGVQCAYLNTFYNSKSAYNTARREHIKFLRGTTADTTPLPPTQVSSQYDRAISKSQKVLEVYPKSKDWHDDAIYLMGKASFYKGEMSTAIRRFHRLQREFPQSPFIPESYLYLGKAYLADDNLAKAEETFQYILQKYPQLNSNEDVTFLLALVAIKTRGKSRGHRSARENFADCESPGKEVGNSFENGASLYGSLSMGQSHCGTLGCAAQKRFDRACFSG